MNIIHEWIGIIISCTGAIVILFFILQLVYDFLNKQFLVMWRVVEYTYYRKEFKEWVKNKERHTKLK